MPPPRLSNDLITSSTRFISDSKARIGKCLTFGCSTNSQFLHLADTLKSITGQWRHLVVGREGYVVAPKRAGLFRHKIAWGDHDQMGHVNNVRYNFWAETARINWARNLALDSQPAHRQAWEELWTPKGVGLILRSIKTDYKFPLQFPDRITVYHKLLTKPTEGMDALLLEAVVLSETHQRVAARVTEDIVVYDYRIGKKAPLPPFMIEALAQIWEEQDSATVKATGQILSLNDQIRIVEKETWDREDAVEDLGSATGSL